MNNKFNEKLTKCRMQTELLFEEASNRSYKWVLQFPCYNFSSICITLLTYDMFDFKIVRMNYFQLFQSGFQVPLKC